MQVIDKITGDVKHYLKSLNGTQNVVLLSNPPLSSEAISEWELTNNATLPSDLKAFFMVCNGLTLKWSASLFTQANQDPLLSVNPNVSHTGESHSVSARLDEDENTREESREMATYLMATSTTN